MDRSNVIYLILRRMRTPLIVLVCTYSLSILGFVLIPGQDDLGNPWRMDFFHALYFVSFMGSTIGFGEIPYPFTGAQRLWTLFTIYATVVSWLYAIGNLIALIQTPVFQAAVTRSAFLRRVRKLNRPFYVVCGYGDTGQSIVHALIEQELDCVVIDINADRINELELQDLPREVPHLNADGSDTNTLARAGIVNRFCRGVIAVTRNDSVNLKVAIAARLLNPGARVYCWAEHHDTVANMASFGTDFIVNPYDAFADYLSIALTSPNRYLLHHWLTVTPPGSPPVRAITPPRGRWLICGYGRFGKAVYRKLLEHGLPVTVIEVDPDVGLPRDHIQGRGTEAETLIEADIHKSVGIIAGTDNDVNNLSILVTARELKPDLFTIARRELSSNSAIFEAAGFDLVTSNSSIVARRILSQIASPMTTRFLSLATGESEEWARELVDRLRDSCDRSHPVSWIVTLDRQSAPGCHDRLAASNSTAAGSTA